MWKKRVSLAVLLLLMAILVSSCTWSRDGQGEKELLGENSGSSPIRSGGQTAPDFTLSDLKGRQIQLSELRGQKVLINFWTTWCPYCLDEMALLQRFYNENKEKN